MATTTNYSWTTPDDTDLVKDGASAIRTLGSSADTTVKNLNPGTTAGDIDYYTSGTAKARVGIGTAGQLLAVNSGATAPEWINAPGGGKVLQVVAATAGTTTTNSTSTLANTGLTATITPSAASSKVLVLVSQQGVVKDQNSLNALFIVVLRDATTIADYYRLGFTATALEIVTSCSFSILDTPNTTSAVTYKTQFANTFNGSSVTVNEDSDSTIVLLEIGA